MIARIEWNDSSSFNLVCQGIGGGVLAVRGTLFDERTGSGRLPRYESDRVKSINFERCAETRRHGNCTAVITKLFSAGQNEITSRYGLNNVETCFQLCRSKSYWYSNPWTASRNKISPELNVHAEPRERKLSGDGSAVDFWIFERRLPPRKKRTSFDSWQPLIHDSTRLSVAVSWSIVAAATTLTAYVDATSKSQGRVAFVKYGFELVAVAGAAIRLPIGRVP